MANTFRLYITVSKTIEVVTDIEPIEVVDPWMDDDGQLVDFYCPTKELNDRILGSVGVSKGYDIDDLVWERLERNILP